MPSGLFGIMVHRKILVRDANKAKRLAFSIETLKIVPKFYEQTGKRLGYVIAREEFQRTCDTRLRNRL